MAKARKPAKDTPTASAVPVERPTIDGNALLSRQERTQLTIRPEMASDCSQLDPVTRRAMLLDLRAGMGVIACSKKHGVSEHTAIELRRIDSEEQGVDLAHWKRSTAATLSQFVARGGNRLMEEVDKIPLATLPVAVAIAVDKILALHDQPQVVTEHRLRVRHEDINDLILNAKSVVVEEPKPDDPLKVDIAAGVESVASPLVTGTSDE